MHLKFKYNIVIHVSLKQHEDDNRCSQIKADLSVKVIKHKEDVHWKFLTPMDLESLA